MSNKVKLPKAICDLLDKAMDNGTDKAAIVEMINRKKYRHADTIILNDQDADTIMRALVLGYEPELSPSDKLHELFNDPPIHDRWDADEAYRKGITDTLDTLGIRLEWSGDPNE